MFIFAKRSMKTRVKYISYSLSQVFCLYHLLMIFDKNTYTCERIAIEIDAAILVMFQNFKASHFNFPSQFYLIFTQGPLKYTL